MNDKFRIIVLKSGVLLGDDTLKSVPLGDDTHQKRLFCLLLKCDKEVKFHYHTRHGKSGKKQSRSTVLTDGLVCFYQASQLFQIRTFDRPPILWYDEINKEQEVSL